jgi:hypothetical protein
MITTDLSADDRGTVAPVSCTAGRAVRWKLNRNYGFGVSLNRNYGFGVSLDDRTYKP